MINKHLTKRESENKQYQNIYNVAGTNDCSSSEKSVEILNSATKVIQNEKKNLKSSVPPHTDNGSAQLKLENFNLSLKSLFN